MTANTKPLFNSDARAWATEQFGGCDLGDIRRTRRLVEYAARQADMPGGSTNAVCEGSEAAAEGAYRMIRNRHIDPKAIEEGPFALTAQRCAARRVVLAIQDTMTVMVTSALGEKLGNIGKEHGRGMLVHSTLAVDGETGEPIGLLDQLRWTRSDDSPGRNTRRERSHEAKESFKWKACSQAISERLPTMANIITVCDREADIYEFLQYHVELNQRFVVRSRQDRVLVDEDRLHAVLAERPVIGEYEVFIDQRGGQQTRPSTGQTKREARQGRTATMMIRTARVELEPPRQADSDEPITMNVVLATEDGRSNDDSPPAWLLFTSEPVETKQEALAVIRAYELRWLIEEFHKAWKTGCRIHKRPVQTEGNLHRLMAITAHVAVRLLQLRSAAQINPERSCEHILDPDELQCLTAVAKQRKSSPPSPPTVQWATQAIAKLAGWRDTKRTGRIGWEKLWEGWAKLEDLVMGWRLARDASP